MKVRGFMKKLFRFHTKGPKFSLGDHSWNRPPAPQDDSRAGAGEYLEKDLAKNRSILEHTFELPDNKDIVVREFQIPRLKKTALIIFIDGLTDRNTQNFAILQPLMLLEPENLTVKDPILTVLGKMLPGHQIAKTKRLQSVIEGILDGSTALLIEGADEALIIETKGWDRRGVERPESEHVVRGPQEGFTETFRSNTASVRRYLKDPKLITEILRVGRRSSTQLAIMYIKDIANPKLVAEVKYRIQSISDTVDYVCETGMLEELLEDNPRSFFPQFFSSERPDRIAAFIREGNVGIIMANSPYSLIIPTNFSIFLHAAEDYYLRWPFSNFLRFIRTISIFIALMLPSLYIAVVNYHQEMIPTDLLLAITTSREAVPFPAIVEILFMELAFELIREAGVRIPSVIGPTIGIVGALILGQAAVAASIVSPILIIIIAITAISSFVVPNYNASFTIRILRFVFILLAGFLGFLGIAFGIFIMTLHMAQITNFGAPFLTPIAPYRPKNKDRIIRPQTYKQPYRPVYLRPLDWIRQAKTPRPWDRPELHSDSQGDEDL
ncbi:MAG: spore germination protein [Firmicutes bacterium]|nr:spore germination protein [Bacillota bacterium]